MSTKSLHCYVENLVIEVENTLFSVPKHALALPGTSFESMLLLPHGQADSDDSEVEGRSDSNPIRLDQGITAVQFTHFLSVAYPFPNIPSPSTFDQWMAVYNLAAMWAFDDVRVKVMEELNQRMSPMEGLMCIKLGHQHGVAPWIKGGFIKLIRNENPLDIQQLHESGLDSWTICTLFSIRENLLLVVTATPPPITRMRNAMQQTPQFYRTPGGGIGTRVNTPYTGMRPVDMPTDLVKMRLRNITDEDALAAVHARLGSQFDFLVGNGRDEFRLPSIRVQQSVSPGRVGQLPLLWAIPPMA